MAELIGKGYDYWALGHVHARSVLSQAPWVVFTGNLQGRHVNEPGPKGATLLTVRDGAIAAAEHVDLDVVRWAHLRVDLSGCTVFEESCGRIQQALSDAADDADGLVRIAYNSCRNRHCPKCQGLARAQWLADRQAELLPVPYFHVVFTVPIEIAVIAFHNKAVDQTWFGYSARSRTHDPSLSQRRPRLGCFGGTLSPSRRQIRSTRLGLTIQPAGHRRAEHPVACSAKAVEEWTTQIPSIHSADASSKPPSQNGNPESRTRAQGKRIYEFTA